MARLQSQPKSYRHAVEILEPTLLSPEYTTAPVRFCSESSRHASRTCQLLLLLPLRSCHPCTMRLVVTFNSASRTADCLLRGQRGAPGSKPVFLDLTVIKHAHLLPSEGAPWAPCLLFSTHCPIVMVVTHHLHRWIYLGCRRKRMRLFCFLRCQHRSTTCADVVWTGPFRQQDWDTQSLQNLRHTEVLHVRGDSALTDTDTQLQHRSRAFDVIRTPESATFCCDPHLEAHAGIFGIHIESHSTASGVSQLVVRVLTSVPCLPGSFRSCNTSKRPSSTPFSAIERSYCTKRKHACRARLGSLLRVCEICTVSATPSYHSSPLRPCLSAIMKPSTDTTVSIGSETHHARQARRLELTIVVAFVGLLLRKWFGKAEDPRNPQ